MLWDQESKFEPAVVTFSGPSWGAFHKEACNTCIFNKCTILIHILVLANLNLTQ
jgi:hypothetical protein